MKKTDLAKLANPEGPEWTNYYDLDAWLRERLASNRNQHDQQADSSHESAAPAAPTASAQGSNDTNSREAPRNLSKSAEIRKLANQLHQKGEVISPDFIIATMKKRGIPVVRPHVTTVLRLCGLLSKSDDGEQEGDLFLNQATLKELRALIRKGGFGISPDIDRLYKDDTLSFIRDALLVLKLGGRVVYSSDKSQQVAIAKIPN